MNNVDGEPNLEPDLGKFWTTNTQKKVTFFLMEPGDFSSTSFSMENNARMEENNTARFFVFITRVKKWKKSQFYDVEKNAPCEDDPRGCFCAHRNVFLSILSAQSNPARIWLKNVSSLHDS